MIRCGIYWRCVIGSVSQIWGAHPSIWKKATKARSQLQRRSAGLSNAVTCSVAILQDQGPFKDDNIDGMGPIMCRFKAMDRNSLSLCAVSAKRQRQEWWFDYVLHASSQSRSTSAQVFTSTFPFRHDHNGLKGIQDKGRYAQETKNSLNQALKFQVVIRAIFKLWSQHCTSVPGWDSCLCTLNLH